MVDVRTGRWILAVYQYTSRPTKRAILLNVFMHSTNSKHNS